ncbi:MAG TPA: outer membrane protein assembly factor BamA [Acidobacteriota bacterium]|nr:outer membrane protein assembly factor BamA [Acidobacteriota bacterium]
MTREQRRRTICRRAGSLSRAALLSLAFLAVLPEGMAQQAEQASQRIEEIRIIGNRRIPESTVRFYIQSKENDLYNEQQILRDYRSLLGTNFFRDATVRWQQGETGIIVIYEVEERPLIRALEYNGMSSFKESDVLEQFRDMRVGLSVDTPFDEARLSRARRAIRTLLELNGRPLGRVEIDVEPITATSVRLVFNIDEGPKVRIGDISFEGNTVISDGELRDALELNKERGLMTVFKGTDKYIPDKLEYDVQVNLLAKYREQGYIFARAGDPEVAIVEAPRGMLVGFRKTKQQYYITVPIQEGDQYTVGSFQITGVENFNPDFIRGVYNVEPGEIVNYAKLQEATDSLKELYSALGFLDMEAFPDIDPDPQTLTVDISVNITEGNRYTVNRINFAGNTKTRDKVLRREFVLEEQEEFNGQLLDISIRRINQLGFFEMIEEKDYEVIKKPQESEVDILLRVKERSQQSIGLTGGVSGISGSFFGINYQSNNFRGMGERIDVQLLTGTRTANYMFSYTMPYFMDTRTSVSLSVFNQRFRFDTFTAFFGLISPDQNIALFTRKTTGFTVGASHPAGRWKRVGLRYSLQNISISDVAELFEDFAFNQLIGFTPGGSIEDARRGIIRSEVTPSFMYNSKNAFFSATQGQQFTAEVPVAGGPLGGSFNIVRPFVEYQYFTPDRFLSGGRNTLAFRTEFQHILSFGRTPAGEPMSPPFFERIFQGGEFNLRGFDIRSVSPFAFTRTPRLDGSGNPLIDPGSGLPLISEQMIPVGGDTSLLANVEYRIPIVGPLQLNAFFDVGTNAVFRKSNLRLFGPDTFIDLLENTNNVLRASTGTEVQFLLPVINQPFRLIFAYNPIRLDSDVVLNGVRFPLREPRTNTKFTVGYNF